MKKITILFLFILARAAMGQSLNVFDINSSSFPTIKAKFIAYDSYGTQITNFSNSDFNVLEDGKTRNVTLVSCPSNNPPPALSSALVIDVSGSMYGRNIILAKAAATAWVEGLPLGKSECAITSFNGLNFLNQDFTSDKNKLLTAIQNLTPMGGTDYDAAFINRLAGGLLITKKAKYKRVLVFLSDGEPNQEPETNKIIAEANSQNCVIFTVTLGMRCPQSLIDIATKTGGQYFENVTTVEEARQIYQQILNTTQEYKPCDIQWLSEASCLPNLIRVDIKLLKNGSTANASYPTPIDKVASLEFEPLVLNFPDPEIGVKIDKKVTLSAHNSDFKITNITCDNAAFTISPTSFNLNPGESIELTVSFLPKDSSYNFAEFEIESSLCPTQFYASGGWKGKKPKVPTLKVTFPNGGESFVVGSDSIITWKGIPDHDLTQIFYSTNNGQSWKYIDTARGLSYKWKNIPLPTSTQCLIKVQQKENSELLDKPNRTTLALGGDVIWSQDGRIIATYGRNSITLLNSITLDTIRTLAGHSYYLTCISISPDGKTIASGSADRTIKLWDISTGALIFTFISQNERINSISFSPDGKTLASAGESKIVFWDVSSCKELRRIEGLKNSIYIIRFSPNGNILATIDSDRKINLWDGSTGNLIRTINLYNGNSNIFEFSPDGKAFATVNYDHKIQLWDFTTGTIIRELQGHSADINSICFKPDGNMIASWSFDQTIKLWDISSGNLIRTIPEPDDIGYLKFSPNGFKLASVGIDLKIWEVSSGRIIATQRGSGGYIDDLSINPDGTNFALFGYKSIRLWNKTTGELIRSTCNFEGAWGFNYSPVDDILAVNNKDHSISLWDVNSGKRIKTFIGHNVFISSVNFSYDGKFLVSASLDSTIKVWDISTGALLKTIKGINSGVDCAIFSPDGEIIASICNDNTLKLWNATNGNFIRTIISSNSSFHGLSFSPDGKFLASALISHAIQIWNVATGKLFKTLIGHSNTISCISFSPDGKFLASGSEDKRIILWDAATGKEIRKLTGHYGAVTVLRFTPDGCSLVSGSEDGTAKLWTISGNILQEDQSDSVFSIVAPLIASKDIDMQKCLVNTAKDSLVTEFVINKGSYDCRIDSIFFKGNDKSAFSIASGFPKYKVTPGDSHQIELRFKPNRVGPFSAQIVIITQADTLYQNIIGEGVMPELAIINDIIDFGKVNVGAAKDTIDAVTIKNIGSSTLIINDTKHNKPNDYDFSTVKGGGSFTLAPGETRQMNLKFAPISSGRTSGRLEFYYNGVGSPATLGLFGEGVQPEIEIISKSIDFGEILIGDDSTKLQEATIKNIGNGVLSVNDLKITNSEFELLSGSSNFEVAPEQTVKLDLKFTPSKLGICNAYLEFYNNLTSTPTIVKLTGIGTTIPGKVDAVFQVLDAESFAGKDIEIPIILRNANNISNSKITGFNVDLSFNPTLLYTSDYPIKVVDDKTAIIKLENLPVNTPVGQAITKIKFKTALGNSENCDFVLSSPKILGDSATITLINGKYTLLGICEAGGKRLINPNSTIGIQSVTPNPANESIKIDFSITEKGTTELILMNILGEVVRSLFIDTNSQLGSKSEIISLESYPQGSYVLILKTPTVQICKTISIIK